MTQIIVANPFTHEELMEAVNANPASLAKAAKALTAMDRGVKVTVQLLRQWISRLDESEVAADHDRSRELIRSRNAMAENAKLRRDLRAMTETVMDQTAITSAIEQLCADLPTREPVEPVRFIGGQSGAPTTVEILLSDLQIGKLGPGYNTPVARKRLFEYGRALLFQIEQKASVGYRMERIVLGLLGDIIESDEKHKNSARACDSGTSEQMYDATIGIFEFIIEPLAKLGIPLDVICVTGNHDWNEHGINMFEPGKTHLSWPMYKLLEVVTRRSGYLNVTFDIPEGSYAIVEFYGQKALYEHGVGVANTEASMKAHKIKRAEQEREHLTYFRMGDKHTVTTFNGGQMVVNGAFFGAGPGGKEYSGIAGYASVPAQWMGFHVPRNDNRLTLYDQFVVQLDHIGE